jgi:hypothetical protein
MSFMSTMKDKTMLGNTGNVLHQYRDYHGSVGSLGYLLTNGFSIL